MKLIEAEKAKDVIHEYFKSLMVNGASGTDVDRLAAGIGSCLKHDANLLKAIDKLPSAEPEAISKWKKEFREYVDSLDITRDDWKGIIEYINDVPTVQPDTTTHDSIPAETGKNDGDRTTNDLISRQAVLNATSTTLRITGKENAETVYGYIKKLCDDIKALPSAQPERTCVNCGRTVNNGGWYADGGTRCPIEEHYALPKDGYCHLWEKRNVTDDDYPERREE